MKTDHRSTALALAALVMTFSAHAHDPKEHMQEAGSPDCAAVQNMDDGAMNASDAGDDAAMHG